MAARRRFFQDTPWQAPSSIYIAYLKVLISITVRMHLMTRMKPRVRKLPIDSMKIFLNFTKKPRISEVVHIYFNKLSAIST